LAPYQLFVFVVMIELSAPRKQEIIIARLPE
jgi:hypothetical protein